ncbi:hypothetical protein AAHA92_07672 [Salvia divinorum]|uniref:Myb/SANT-like domain-containing protein n=1 Tax=Salvia divinorum TaxID=28513 RepID=A0ABD1ICD5_SALDI
MAYHRTQSDDIDMSPGMEGSSDFGRLNSVKGDRSRRSWSDREEATLILALKDLVATGSKSDNGFRAGSVGFNVNEDFKIDCDDEQWSQIVKKDNNARYMRTKSWPHWEDWKEIYGKDRAIGHKSLGTSKAANGPHVEQNNLNDDIGSDYHSADPIEGVLQLMTHIHEDTHEVLTTLSTRIGYEFDQSTKRAEVYELLGVIPGLTLK